MVNVKDKDNGNFATRSARWAGRSVKGHFQEMYNGSKRAMFPDPDRRIGFKNIGRAYVSLYKYFFKRKMSLDGGLSKDKEKHDIYLRTTLLDVRKLYFRNAKVGWFVALFLFVFGHIPFYLTINALINHQSVSDQWGLASFVIWVCFTMVSTVSMFVKSRDMRWMLSGEHWPRKSGIALFFGLFIPPMRFIETNCRTDDIHLISMLDPDLQNKKLKQKEQ